MKAIINLLVILFIVLSVQIVSAQKETLYSIASIGNGIYMAGEEIVIEETETIAITLNELTNYTLTIYGKDITISMNNVVLFFDKTTSFDITTANEKLVIYISASPNKTKKGKLIYCLKYLNKAV